MLQRDGGGTSASGHGVTAARPDGLARFAGRSRGAAAAARARVAETGSAVARLAGTRPEGLSVDTSIAPALDRWLTQVTEEADHVDEVGRAFSVADTLAEQQRQARIAELRAHGDFQMPSTWELVRRTAWQMVSDPLGAVDAARERPADAVRGFGYGTAGAAVVLGGWAYLAGAGAVTTAGGAVASAGTSVAATSTATVGATTATTATTLGHAAVAASWMSTASEVGGALAGYSACPGEAVTFSLGTQVLGTMVSGPAGAAGMHGFSTLTDISGEVTGKVVDPC